MGKIEDLEKLKSLKTSGAITEQEFEQEKRKILNDNETNKKTTKLKLNYIIIPIIVIISIIVVYMYIPKMVEVPNLVGMTVEQAEEQTRKIGLQLRPSTDKSENEIIESQSQEVGAILEKDAPIYVWTEEYNNSQSRNNNSITASTGTVTTEKFNKIQNGMTYEQVCNIMGFKGELTSEYDATKIYLWTDSDFNTIGVTFVNNISVVKTKI